MGCFPCFESEKESPDKDLPIAQPKTTTASPNPSPHPPECNRNTHPDNANNTGTSPGDNNGAKAFTFRELASATKNFRQECLLSESGIGRVFKGTLHSSGQAVAVRQLERSAAHESKDFQAQVLTLSQLDHPNLLKLIGYCTDGDQRLLVYQYMPLQALDNNLFDVSEDKLLDWLTRMKIALGVADGLEYLHEKVNPSIMCGSLKASTILLDETKTPKLSEYGLAKLLESSSKMNASAYGYCAPECERHGDVTIKSDVYSFGVVLLELITGRKAYDGTRPTQEQSLVSWAMQFFSDPKKFPEMVDPLLRNGIPTTSLNQAVGVASMCIHEEPSVRPFISDIVAALSFLAMAPPESPIPPNLVPILSSSRVAATDNVQMDHD